MKAILMSHEHGGSYVMNQDGCFQFVKGYASQPVGTQIDIKPQVQPLVFYAKAAKVAALAACLVFAVAIGSFSWMWNAESYSVYMDINPSVELVFNNLNKLKDAKPLNEDGAALLAETKLKGSPEDVVIALIREAEHKGYINSASDATAVSVVVTARGGKSPEVFLTRISAALDKNGLQGLVEIDVCSTDFRKKAEDLGVSPGKLKLAERLFSEDQSMPIDEIVKMTVKDLMAAIKEAETAAKEDNPNKGPGNNSGNGSGSDSDKEDNPNKGPENNSGNNGNGKDKEDNPNKGPGNNSGNNKDKEDNPNKGPGNNSGNGSGSDSDKEDNPNKGPGNNSGNGSGSDKEDNPNKGPGNNSGNSGSAPKEDNPNKGPDNNSGNVKEPNPNSGSGNNSGSDKEPNPNSGPSKEKEDNPNKGSGNNSGNGSGSAPKEDNPNKGPGNNSGNGSAIEIKR